MKTLLPLVLILTIIGACDNPADVLDAQSSIEDRIWIDFDKEYEFYLSSKDKIIFGWYMLDSKNNFPCATTPPHEGNIKRLMTYEGGWSPVAYFKVKGDSIEVQDLTYPAEGRYEKSKITFLNDTTIGVFTYNQINPGGNLGERWLSKKK